MQSPVSGSKTNPLECLFPALMSPPPMKKANRFSTKLPSQEQTWAWQSPESSSVGLTDRQDS